jgi:hypothetical protein
MSVHREYVLRISPATENSGTRPDLRESKDGGKKDSGNDGEPIEIAPPELHGALAGLEDVLPGAGRLLRAAFDLKTSGAAEILSALGKIKTSARSEKSFVPFENQFDAKASEELPAADGQALDQPPDGLNNSGDSTPAGANAPAAPAPSSDGAGRGDLMNQMRQFQNAFQAQAPAISQQDAIELLSVIRQVGEAFFQQSQNGVTKQEFEREKIALRRLIESKGK